MYCDKDKNNKELDKDDKRAVLSGWTAPRGQARLRPWRPPAHGGSKCRRRRALGGSQARKQASSQARSKFFSSEDLYSRGVGGKINGLFFWGP